MLLIQDPELLMLDEPVAGMSVSEREKTAELLNRIIKDRSVLVIEHDMKFVEDIAHKVTVLHQGRSCPKARWSTSRTIRRSSKSIWALAHDPGKWRPVSGQDHARRN